MFFLSIALLQIITEGQDSKQKSIFSIFNHTFVGLLSFVCALGHKLY